MRPLENTSKSFAGGAVSILFSAQAFHWFNGSKALEEIHRVLKTGGKLGLIWNARDESLDWVSTLPKIIDPHEGGAPRYKSMKWKEAFAATNLFSDLHLKQFSYMQVGNLEMILDRVGSISFISALPEGKKEEVLNQVRELIQNHPETKDRPEIRLPYRTDVYWCEAR
ncbi:MAG: methyltransferase domain-containing protein [Pseudobdellovibrionaceae bacterium]